MKKFIALAIFTLLVNTINVYSQQRTTLKKIKITGIVKEAKSNQPLEYATITFIDPINPKTIAGGITNAKGEFVVEINSGNYDLKIEFISFKPYLVKSQKLEQNTNLGLITLEEDETQLNEVIVRSEKTTVEIKLDKKVYNVGNDLMVKGGTVSDVLDNIPSVSVDVEGNISLRGNENVRILIDGRPSNAINITEALRLIPSDAIDKVEVITNPSARYDAEGGGGLLNIILKKGKNNGLNGTFIASAAYPESYGLSGNLNYKSENFNLFTTQGLNKRSNPGNGKTDAKYLNSDNSIRNYVYEKRENDRLSDAYNGNFGAEWYLNKKTTWTNSFSYRKSNGDNIDNVIQENYNSSFIYDYSRNRINNENSYSEDKEYATNLIKNFKKDGHKLTIDGSFSSSDDIKNALIIDTATNTNTEIIDKTINNQYQTRNLFQTDYVLPIGKGSQFETGYKGEFLKLTTDYKLENDGVINDNFTNTIEYIEKVNALYTSYGFKIKKYSFLFGARYEDSYIEINQLATNDFNTKKYNNLFPSAFLTYELSDQSSASLSYSRRIQRPRGRQLNPFNNLSSNINIFVGNPDLNPSISDVIDFGYLKRWNKLTLNTSLYLNKTSDVIQSVRRESGDFINSVPVIFTTFANIATEYRAGFEFTLNYSPYKWWKLNGNFNFFRNETQGNFAYTNFNNVVITQNFDNIASSWFTRVTSKVTLPYNIDWQTNATYNGPQNNAQGKTFGVFSANIAFSKDVLKDKGTINFNISDIFNSRKRIWETNIPGVVISNSVFQRQERQINLSFTYRFNKKKGEKDRQPRRDSDGGDDF